jgi:hypothetical protein
VANTGYTYGGDTLTTNTWYWACQNPATNAVQKCSKSFECTGTTPANSTLCPYSNPNTTPPKSDARELTQNVNKHLIGAEGSKCGTVNSPALQLQACSFTANQTDKCEYYCNEGYHRKGQQCIPNSCPAQSKTYTDGALKIVFPVPCLDHGATTTVSTSIKTSDGKGTLTYISDFSCNLGKVSAPNPTYRLQCDAGYTPSGTTCVPKGCPDSVQVINTRQYNVPTLANNTSSTQTVAITGTPANGKTVYSVNFTCSNGSISASSETSKIECNSPYTLNGTTCIDCSGYPLTSCPVGGNCSSCANKYKLNSCQSDYKQSGNTCVLKKSFSVNSYVEIAVRWHCGSTPSCESGYIGYGGAKYDCSGDCGFLFKKARSKACYVIRKEVLQEGKNCIAGTPAKA